MYQRRLGPTLRMVALTAVGLNTPGVRRSGVPSTIMEIRSASLSVSSGDCVVERTEVPPVIRYEAAYSPEHDFEFDL